MAKHNWWFETSVLLEFVRFLNFWGHMDRLTLIGLVAGALLMSGILLLLTFSWRTLDMLNLLISLN